MKPIIDNFRSHTIELEEKFNMQAMSEHIYSGHCDLQRVQQLSEYMKLATRDVGTNIATIKITYTVPELGRLTSGTRIGKEIRYVQSQSFQTNDTKCLVAGEIYDDVDMVNCQPVLLEQLMLHHGFDTKYIRAYNKHRESILAAIMLDRKIIRKKAKTVIYNIMFNSRENNARKIKSLRKYPVMCKYIKQLMRISGKILDLYPQFRAMAIRKKGADYWNITGSALAFLCQHLERICLIPMYKYFLSKGLKVGALIHDGLHLEKSPKAAKHLTWCEKYVLKQTGFRVSIKIKPFELRPQTNEIRFNTMSGITKLSVKRHTIRSRYLTKRGAADKLGYELADKLKPDCVNLVKSFTGSGKTEMIKKLRARYPNYKLLSLVSRRTLADMHAAEFNLTNYQTVKQLELNSVCQLDSINKVPCAPTFKYILILDEVASLCSHFLNHMRKMSTNRLKFIKMFANLINHKQCKMVVGMDANINYGTIQFMSGLTDRAVHLFKNKFQLESKVPVTLFTDKYHLLHTLIAAIKGGGNAYVCSNVNDDFKREIVDAVKRECNLKPNEFLLYSSNDGENYIDTKKWVGKRCIFATPSIIYGCDSNYGFHVFAFYYNGAHFDAMDMNQQINRERNPGSMNIYMTNSRCKPYASLKHTKKDTKTKFQLVSTVGDGTSKYIPMAEKLCFYEEYRRSHFLNTRVHLFDLLRQKGYTNTHVNIGMSNKIKHLTREEQICALINKYHNGELSSKMYDDLLNKFEIFGIDLSTPNDKKVEYFETVIDKHLDKFISRSKYTQLVNYGIYKLGKYNKLKRLGKNTKTKLKKYQLSVKNYDIIENIIKSTSTKLYLLNKLRRKLRFRRFQSNIRATLTKKTCNEKIELTTEFADLVNEAFRVRSKTKALKTTVTRGALTQFYCSRMNSLIGFVMSPIVKEIGGKRFKFPIFDAAKLAVVDDLLSVRDSIKAIGPNDEYDGFLFGN